MIINRRNRRQITGNQIKIKMWLEITTFSLPICRAAQWKEGFARTKKQSSLNAGKMYTFIRTLQDRPSSTISNPTVTSLRLPHGHLPTKHKNSLASPSGASQSRHPLASKWKQTKAMSQSAECIQKIQYPYSRSDTPEAKKKNLTQNIKLTRLHVSNHRPITRKIKNQNRNQSNCKSKSKVKLPKNHTSPNSSTFTVRIPVVPTRRQSPFLPLPSPSPHHTPVDTGGQSPS